MQGSPNEAVYWVGIPHRVILFDREGSLGHVMHLLDRASEARRWKVGRSGADLGDASSLGAGGEKTGFRFFAQHRSLTGADGPSFWRC